MEIYYVDQFQPAVKFLLIANPNALYPTPLFEVELIPGNGSQPANPLHWSKSCVNPNIKMKTGYHRLEQGRNENGF